MMAGVVLSVILIMALILGVYIFGVYTASREDSEMHIEKENKDKNVIIEIFFEVILSFIIVFSFMFIITASREKTRKADGKISHYSGKTD